MKLVNIDKQLATKVADYIGVTPPTGEPVNISISYPSLSQENMPKRPDTLKVGVLVGNNFNGKELAETLAVLEENNVYVEMISETLQPVTCATGTEFTIDQTFLTFSPYLVDALYVVGGDAKNNDKFMYDVRNFIQVVYDYYKPIAVASTAEMYIQHMEKNNLSGVIFANNNDHFHHDFIEAITKQRFWERKKRLGQNQS